MTRLSHESRDGSVWGITLLDRSDAAAKRLTGESGTWRAEYTARNLRDRYRRLIARRKARQEENDFWAEIFGLGE